MVNPILKVNLAGNKFDFLDDIVESLSQVFYLKYAVNIGFCIEFLMFQSVKFKQKKAEKTPDLSPPPD